MFYIALAFFSGIAATALCVASASAPGYGTATWLMAMLSATLLVLGLRARQLRREARQHRAVMRIIEDARQRGTRS